MFCPAVRLPLAANDTRRPWRLVFGFAFRGFLQRFGSGVYRCYKLSGPVVKCGGWREVVDGETWGASDGTRAGL